MERQLRGLNGKTAIITGSSRGIGKSIAKELASFGANIIVNYLNHPNDAEQTVRDIEEIGQSALAIKADVSDKNQVDILVQTGVDAFGNIDILVNNAGINIDRSLKNLSFPDWERVLNVNLFGCYNCTRSFLPYLAKNEEAYIVNISSVIGQTGSFGQSNYAASKAGIIGFTKACALEFAKCGITVNAVCPGFIRTSMLESIPPSFQDELLLKIPLRRFGFPEEIARCVRFLVTEGTYITGQCINVNGGLAML